MTGVAVLPDKDVRAVWDGYDPQVRSKLLQLRALIVSVSTDIPQIGQLTETLKWGQISYLPQKSGIGSTIRIDQTKDNKHSVSVFFICTSGLTEQFYDLYPHLLCAGEKRVMRFALEDPLPEAELSHCFALALTSHLRKSGRFVMPVR